jgi:Fe-S-cluster-containing dehydrogenase component/CRP-like cAMP-binding protein
MFKIKKKSVPNDKTLVGSSNIKPSDDKTMLREIALYNDRWSAYGENTGIVSISHKLSVEQLKAYEIFQGYDDAFLTKICPDISIATWKRDAILFKEGDYIDVAFFISSGGIDVYLQQTTHDDTPAIQPIFDEGRTMIMSLDQIKRDMPKQASVSQALLRPAGIVAPKATENTVCFLSSMDFNLPRGGGTRLGEGEIFGEIGAMSGWPQSVTARVATESTLIQIRVPALRLMKKKSAGLKTRVDARYKERSLSSQLKITPLFQNCKPAAITALKEAVDLISCEPDEVIIQEGELSDAIYLVRSGFVKLLQKFSEGEMVVSYLSKGMFFGEVELLLPELPRWEMTAVSVEYAELVKIPKAVFTQFLRDYPTMEDNLWQMAVAKIKEAGKSRRNIGASEFIETAVHSGLVQANSLLVMDLNTCTRCDDCVRACAETHNGRPRFVREGNKYNNLLIPKSCYHCRDPVCLVGCPTGAIARTGVGAVVAIDDRICIGCSSCAKKCPYDAIVMHKTGDTWPQDTVPVGLRGSERFVASKCDLCSDTGHGPACVSNCPNGSASRISSLDAFLGLLSK